MSAVRAVHRVLGLSLPTHWVIGPIGAFRPMAQVPATRPGVALPPAARAFVGLSVLAAFLLVLGAARTLGNTRPVDFGDFDPHTVPALAVLAQFVALAALTPHFPLPLGPGRKYDLSQPVHFAILLVAGAPLATLLVFAGAAIGQASLLLRRDRNSGAPLRLPVGAVFNTCQVTIAIAAAGWMAGLACAVAAPARTELAGLDPATLLGAVAAAGTLYLTNGWAVAAMTGLQRGRSPLEVWRGAPHGRALRSASLLLVGGIAGHAAAESPWVPLAMAVPGALIYVCLRNAAEAEASVRLRDEFLGVASHELRTPVTSLRGYAQFLSAHARRGGLGPDPKVGRALDTIERQSATLCTLIEQLLDLSRLGRPGAAQALACASFDAASLARQVATDCQPLAPDLELVVRAPATVPAWGDRVRLEQVLVNLVSNAVRHAGGGGRIDLEVAASHGAGRRGAPGGTVTLAVRDYGIGIPPQFRDQIFDRYRQLGPGTKAGGLGIGLSLAREIVELHGGAVSVECPPDGGSRFVVRIPANSAATAPSARRGPGPAGRGAGGAAALPGA